MCILETHSGRMTSKIILFFCLSICSIYGQKLTTIKGTIKNFDGNTININIYPNWEQNGKEFYIEVDSSGRFMFEIILSDYNYVDLNIGKIGYLFWLIKAGDDIYLLLDYNDPIESFFASGIGASKWVFQHDYFLRYENAKDADFEIKTKYNLDLPNFVSFVDSLANDKQLFLEQKRSKVQDEFFLLKKAEIIGKRNRHLVEYALSKNIAAKEIKKFLELFAVSTERQALSFEFNDFFDEWIAVNKMSDNQMANSLLEELSYLTRLFYNGAIERPMTELKMHQLVLRYVENHSYQPEMEKGTEVYFEFVRNTNLKEKVVAALERKKSFFYGFTLPVLALTTRDGSEYKYKEFAKRNTLIYIYEDDCIICEDDFAYFDLIKSNFDRKDKFQLFTIPLKGNFDLNEISADQEIQLIPQNEVLVRESLSIQNTPEIYFITEEGKVFGDLPEPSLDEGRSLLIAIKNFFPEKKN